MIKRFDGTNFVDISDIKRYENLQWKSMKVKRYDETKSSWKQVFPNVEYLLNGSLGGVTFNLVPSPNGYASSWFDYSSGKLPKRGDLYNIDPINNVIEFFPGNRARDLEYMSGLNANNISASELMRRIYTSRYLYPNYNTALYEYSESGYFFYSGASPAHHKGIYLKTSNLIDVTNYNLLSLNIDELTPRKILTPNYPSSNWQPGDPVIKIILSKGDITYMEFRNYYWNYEKMYTANASEDGKGYVYWTIDKDGVYLCDLSELTGLYYMYIYFESIYFEDSFIRPGATWSDDYIHYKSNVGYAKISDIYITK